MVSHTLINFTDKEVAWAIDMGQQRHGAKHNSFREKSRMGSISKVFGGSHILGVLGELDFKTSKNSDKNFKIDIKTITYNGEGEKELKIKVSEYAKNIPDEYVLIYIDKDNLKEATILGCISRSNFEKNKKEKQYRRDYPSNYYVGESSLRAIKNY